MVAVVLGGGIEKGGKIPDFVKLRLNQAFELYINGKVNKIILCGKYSFLYPKNNLPKKTESQLNKEYLLGLGVAPGAIYMENKSKDTIGNVYYAKKMYFLPKREKSLVVITSDFHIKRAKYLFKRIFGSSYNIKYKSTPSKISDDKKNKIIARQDDLIKQSKDVFRGMKDGEHNFLKNKLYKIKYYKNKRPDWVKKFVSKGEDK